MADAVNPGLHVDDVTYAAGTGTPTEQNGIEQNVSGVYGARFFHRTNASTQNQNPTISLVLTNASVTNGLVASRQPNVLTSADNTTYSGTVWIDDMISGNVVSWLSNQRYYDFILNTVNNDGRYPSGNDALANDLQAQNPGAQLASLSFLRTSGAASYQQHLAFVSGGFNAYQDAYGSSGTNQTELPGFYSTATVFVDEVSLHAVRDIGAFYDEDLCVLP
ncbi:MAG: hypothetical protein H6751_03970 [Candidatus Omnitrophica bacterium]|nr:hypothetical protein [Candidatus Omnitrophota bacterium]